MAKGEKSWEKRLSGKSDPKAVAFVESLSYDRRLYAHDIAGSIAHARMLAGEGLLTSDEFDQIADALRRIGEEIAAGRFAFDPVHEDIHMAIEAALVERTGDVGRKLHTGRSRNDQVATDLRLWMREEIDRMCGRLGNLQRALVDLAGRYAEAIMPAYTHLQRAQPVTIGAYVLSFVEAFERDRRRLQDTRRRVNICPLGSGAVAGSTLPLDRHSTARELGFDDITPNSLDAVADRDFCAEFLFDAALIAAHLSRLAEDWIIYGSNEFGFVVIDDAYCTSSSMMPQKRNFDLLELIRGKTGSAYGALMAMLTLLKAQPSTYNRDLQEDKIHVFAAADVVAASLEMAAAIVAGTEFHVDHIAAGMGQGYLEATALAEYLVGKGVPFRTAHGVVGSLVAECEKTDQRLADLPLERLQAACAAVGADVYETLDPAAVVRRYCTEGAAGPRQTAERLAFWRRELDAR